MAANIAVVKNQTQGVYERQALRFDRERSKSLMERHWLERFSKLLPSGATILDAGCGTGEPIAKFFIDAGFRLIGLDYASSMIDIARSRFPDHTWMVGDMRTLDLASQIDGIIGWHSFFHLTQGEQESVLSLFAEKLRPQGLLLITVGHEKSEVVGEVGGEKVYHSSLAPDEYRRILATLGLDILDFVFHDAQCGNANVIFARKIG